MDNFAHFNNLPGPQSSNSVFYKADKLKLQPLFTQKIVLHSLEMAFLRLKRNSICPCSPMLPHWRLCHRGHLVFTTPYDPWKLKTYCILCSTMLCLLLIGSLPGCDHSWGSFSSQIVIWPSFNPCFKWDIFLPFLKEKTHAIGCFIILFGPFLSHEKADNKWSALTSE